MLALTVAGGWTPGASRAAAVDLGSGAWSWFGDPRAVHFEGQRNATYAAWMAPNGQEVVASWDGRERVRTVLPGRPPPSDDHAAPSVAVLRDGRLMLLSSRHNGDLNWRVSSLPEDVSGWTARRGVGTNTSGPYGSTYPNAVSLGRRGRSLYLFWRGGDWLPAYSRFLGSGRWSPARRLLKPAAGQRLTRDDSRDARPYVKYATNGRTIVFAFTDGHPQNGRTTIRVALLRGGTFYSASGRRIGRRGRPLDPRRADLVRRPDRVRAWVQDVALTPAGRPVVVYASYPVPNHRHAYHYATVRHGRWRRHRITSAGGPIGAVNRRVDGVRSLETFYSGGMGLDHARPSVVYLSRTIGGVHRVERWTTPDGGRRWRRRPVTGRSRASNIRPVVPVGLPDGGSQVLWMSGKYLHYHHFRTSIKIASPFGQPPTATFRVSSARPARTGGRNVAFDPAGSHAGAGRLVSGRWEFGDGTSAATARPVEHRYRAPGRYFARLVLTDATGRRDTFVRELSIR